MRIAGDLGAEHDRDLGQGKTMRDPQTRINLPFLNHPDDMLESGRERIAARQDRQLPAVKIRIVERELALDQSHQNQPAAVYMTILEEPQNPAERVQTGQQMAAILEQLANMNAFTEIADPAAWERAIRSDRDCDQVDEE